MTFLLKFVIVLLAASASLVVHAQTVPAHAEGLFETLLTVELAPNRTQSGVLSRRAETTAPTRLAVLLPGHPSVVRPEVENNVMVRSKLNGNFLIRSRRHLADQTIATLIVDCPSDSGEECASHYQASPARAKDVAKLVAEARRQLPSIEQVWLVGTSMGTISSSFIPTHDPQYAGAIHTASITEPYAPRSYRELIGFDYRKAGIPQVFVHHLNDPCRLTTHAGAKSISEKYGVPLITVEGSSGVSGPACEAFTEHGFRGKEKDVMRAIAGVIKTGEVGVREIR